MIQIFLPMTLASDALSATAFKTAKMPHRGQCTVDSNVVRLAVAAHRGMDDWLKCNHFACQQRTIMTLTWWYHPGNLQQLQAQNQCSQNIPTGTFTFKWKCLD
mmetsp:Transcript_4533/g.9045  ORF Transcript_4533/g.9045 Transcript_4533/m.9045 type:complete len:103 (+) Transcript_4533:983-1291(+)